MLQDRRTAPCERREHRGRSPLVLSLAYALLAATWIIFTSYLMELGPLDAGLARQIELIKGLVFVLMTAGLLYLLLRTRKQEAHGTTQEDLTAYQPNTRHLVVVLVLLLLLVPIVGGMILAYQEPRLQKNAFDELETIAELKAMQIESWIAERFKDGQTLAGDAHFVAHVLRVGAGDARARQQLMSRLDAFREAYGYTSITLLGAAGERLLQSGRAHSLGVEDGASWPEILNHGFELLPVVKDSDGRLHLDLIVPLDASGPTGRRVGAMLVHIEPEQFLFPYLARWPVESHSGENQLVRRDGDVVTFLNQPRFSDAGPLGLRVRMDDTDLPSAFALRGNASGTFTGRDYRQEPVLAAFHPVARSDWQVIAKRDRAEVLAPLYDMLRWIAVVSLVAISVVGASLIIVWRLQQRMYRLAVMAEKSKADRALRHFYELPFIGMAIISPTTRRWLQFNDHLGEILGYGGAELQQLSWDELTHRDDQESERRAREPVLDGAADGYVLDKRFLRKNGEVVYTKVDVKCVRKPDGSPDYMVCTVQDITQRLLAEQAVKDSEALLKSLVNTLPDLVWLKDTEGVYLSCNARFEEFFGAAEAEIVGRTDYDFVDAQLADAFRQNDRKAMDLNRPSINEERLILKASGYQGIFETIKTPFYSANGTLIGILGIARDITQRKQVEQRLSLVIEGSNDAPWDWDLVQDQIYYSPQFWHMLGYEVDELPNDAALWRRLAHPDDLVQVDAALERLIRKGKDRESVECRFRHKDGSFVPTLVRGIASRDENGAAVRLTGTVMDLTERKRLEAEHHESLQRLEKIASRLPGMVYQYQRFADGRHCVPYASDAIEHIFGVSAIAVSDDATPLFAMIHPEDRPGVSASVQHSAQQLSAWRQEFRVRDEGGEVRWLLANAVPQRQPDDSVLWHGFITDITERKAIESEMKLAAKVFEKSREGIMITDAQRRIVMVNKAFTDITGYSEAEALGQSPGMLASDRHDKAFFGAMLRALDTGGFWQGEIWNRRKDGSLYPEWLSITRTTDEHGEVSGYIGIFEDISQRKQYEEHIRWLAHYDPLTKLPNRALLVDRVSHAISAAHRGNKRVSLLFCDVDRFKRVNDALGHSVGDKLLVEVAKRLAAAVREGDTVSRQGGDEFVLLLPDTDADGAARVAEKVLAAVNSPYDLGDYRLTTTFSIGIAVYPDDADSFETLAKYADIAMYRVKQLGRNDYCFFTPELQHMTARSLQLENDMQGAVDRNELELHYQPQVCLENGRISGLEALLRWRHPELGMIPPDEFIPIAERSGQIVRIGEWVLRTAAGQLAQWIAKGLAPLKVAVNLSVRQLKHPHIFKSIKTVLDESGIDPQLLELEMTESILMEDQESLIKILCSISELGVQIAIDDFGTGYSSLAYLKRLPVDVLKIDKTFVQDMLTNPDDAIIARSVITLGHSLGLRIIAEGVETDAQLEFLRLHNCDHFQGYLFSKPLAVAEMTQLLAEPKEVSLLPAPRDGQGPKTILLVDDEKNILQALKRVLRADGYRILTAASGEEGLEVLAVNEVSVIISDQRMPGMSGVEFLSKAKELYPDTVRLVLSGYADLRFVTEAINRGDIYKFLTKPWEDELLRANINEAFHRYGMHMENRRLARELKEAHKVLARLSGPGVRGAQAPAGAAPGRPR